MNDETKRLLSEIEREQIDLFQRQKSLEAKRSRLSGIQGRCPHQWTEPERKSQHHEGYTIPGDPPGTMGVDWRGPCHVPAKTDIWWERTCKLCGKVQKTEKTKPVQMGPDFGG